jgi:hypothetical protein
MRAPRWMLLMSDSPLPKTIGEAVLQSLWNFSPWIFLLLGGERYFEGHYDQAIACVAAWFVNLVIVAKWEKIASVLKGSKLTLILGMVAVVLALGLGLVLGLLWNASRQGMASSSTGRIAWNFEQMDNGQANFLNLLRLNQDEIRVAGVGAHGKNTSKDPVTELRGYVRSDLTNAQLPIFIMAEEPNNAAAPHQLLRPPQIPTRPEETFGIPGLADFDVVTYEQAVLTQGVDGLPLSRFLREFGSFTLVLEYDNIKVEKHFSREMVQKQIDAFEKSINPQRTTAPRVTRRPTAAVPVQSALPLQLPSPSAPPAAEGAPK